MVVVSVAKQRKVNFIFLLAFFNKEEKASFRILWAFKKKARKCKFYNFVNNFLKSRKKRISLFNRCSARCDSQVSDSNLVCRSKLNHA